MVFVSEIHSIQSILLITVVLVIQLRLFRKYSVYNFTVAKSSERPKAGEQTLKQSSHQLHHKEPPNNKNNNRTVHINDMNANESTILEYMAVSRRNGIEYKLTRFFVECCK